MAARKSTAPTPAVVFITGQEDFLVREKLDELLREHVTEEARAFDYNEFRTGDVDARVLWNALITLPLLAERRIVVLHIHGEVKEELQKALLQYIAVPAATTLLIVVQIGDGAPPVKSSGQIEVISCGVIRDASKRAQWARDYAKRFAKELSVEGAEYLVSTSLPRLSDLAAKLDHAILYAGEAREISGQDLLKVAGVSSEYLPWDLEDAILERHPRKVFQIAKSMEDGGEELLRLLAYQRGSLLQLWRLARIRKKATKGKSDQTYQDSNRNKIFTIRDVKEWKLRQFQLAATAFGETRLQQAIVGLMDLEVRIKTGKTDWSGYYDWLWRLLQAPKSHGTSFNP